MQCTKKQLKKREHHSGNNEKNWRWKKPKDTKLSRYKNLKANLEDADMSHLIKLSEQIMAATEDANNDEGGQAHKDTATSEHPSNILPRKDDDGTDEGGPSRPTQA
ncbi:hypothetical protein R1flu_020879 [Riccia fluitans]|uniref:Uncharacterized protein n=1 Tax=Riccia fluitans TaxID=41844 RepID=A0ABD1ZPD4_9MARC